MAKNKEKGSIVGGIVLILVALVAIGGGFTYNFLSKIVHESRPGLVGNGAGNLYNMGLFCETDGRIFFSNYLDDGTLYSMSSDLTDFERINNDYPRFINADDNYIYYSRMNNLKEEGAESIFTFYANGIFRCRKNGKALTMLHNKPVGSVLVYDNAVYYQNYIKNGKISIYKMGIDAEDPVEFIDDESVVCAAYDGRVYYNGFKNDHSLHSAATSNGSGRIEIEQNVYNAVIRSEGIYFIDPLDKYRLKIYRNGETKTLVNNKISAYNITEDGQYIYYQVDGTDDDGIYIYDVSRDMSGLIREGSYKWLNIAGGYCFFYSADESSVYAYKQGAGLSYFNPPVLSD